MPERRPWFEWLKGVQAPEPLGPVAYSPLLVSEVAAVTILAILLAALAVRPPADAITLSIGSASVFLLSLFSVRSLLAVQSISSASTFVQLGLSLTLGPVGAATGGVAEAIAVMVRTRNGWFRTLFNATSHFISGTAAYEVFVHITPILAPPAGPPLAGIAAGLALFAVNEGLLAMILRSVDAGTSPRAILAHGFSLLPYGVGYGWSAFGFVVLHDHAGYLGFTALLAPVALLQGALVSFARRTKSFDEQRLQHAREREALLHRLVDASEAERRRIARDLHDGVVQNLSGMAFALTATSSRLRERGASADNQREALEVLESSAEQTRQAMKDLRTLIIEIAPPTLRREGIHAALLEVLRTLEQAGTKTRLELPSNMRLRQDRASLIFRVAQEVLRNVAAHAEASHVSVVLRELDGHAVLRIEDDGRGFTADDVARRRAQGHVGTSAIEELAEDASGSLRIDSEPGKGTTVVLELPVEA